MMILRLIRRDDTSFKFFLEFGDYVKNCHYPITLGYSEVKLTNVFYWFKRLLCNGGVSTREMFQ